MNELSKEDFLAEIWGPPPTEEQIQEINEWIDRKTLEDAVQVLQSCVTRDHASYRLGVSFEEMMQNITNKTLIALPVDTTHFLPTWQFDEDEQGRWKPNQTVLSAWAIWGKELEQFGFCMMMTMTEESYGKSRLDILLENNDQDAVEEVLYVLRTHGLNYM